jgi:hypothetical protein
MSAIVVTRYYNGKVQVLDAIEIENAEYNEVIDRVWNIKKKYGISTLYCDAANPVIWKPLFSQSCKNVTTPIRVIR